MDGKRWGMLGGAGVMSVLVTLASTNPEHIAGWLTAIESLPVILWAGLAAFLMAFLGPWLVESKVPMADWQGWQFVLTIYGVALFLGNLVGMGIYPHLVTLSVCSVAGLLAQVARDLLTRFWPVFSPTQQVRIGRNEAGDTTLKIGSDPTMVMTRPPQAGTPTVPAVNAAIPPTDLH